MVNREWGSTGQNYLPAARARFVRIETGTLNRFKVMGRQLMCRTERKRMLNQTAGDRKILADCLNISFE